ncbi:MAG: hypothetical protein Ct9H300mP1_03880 [Planctomycetaceae bacterium]|nr:MAG: hypothetical protein Ct9H300mP1_03880 [Planctomycetaceae bacterium]
MLAGGSGNTSPGGGKIPGGQAEGVRECCGAAIAGRGVPGFRGPVRERPASGGYLWETGDAAGALEETGGDAPRENPYGIQTLYEAWLFTSDSQQHPTVLVMTSVPPDS